MTKKRFTVKSQDDYFGVVDNNTEDKVCVVNGIHTEIETEWLCDLLNEQHETIKALEKQCILLHMSSMFNTVKSFKDDLSKRYKYDEETDTIYDTANHYSGLSKIVDKKEATLLLNEYNLLLECD